MSSSREPYTRYVKGSFRAGKLAYDKTLSSTTPLNSAFWEVFGSPKRVTVIGKLMLGPLSVHRRSFPFQGEVLVMADVWNCPVSSFAPDCCCYGSSGTVCTTVSRVEYINSVYIQGMYINKYVFTFYLVVQYSIYILYT